MKKTYTIFAIVLIALMSFALIPLKASAYDTGPSVYPNTNYSTIGPNASSLVMLVYTDPTAEFAAFQKGQIDFMDGSLTPTEYPQIAGNTKYIVTGPVAAFSLYEYDLNDAWLPFNITAYRQGLTCLVDIDYFVNTYMGASGTPAYNPCASQDGWGDPALYNLFHGSGALAPSFITAYVDFCEALGAPTIDTTPAGTIGQTVYPSGTWSTWAFASPIPTTGPNGEPSVLNSHMSIYARTTGADASARTQQGVYLAAQGVTNMPAYFAITANQLALNTTLQGVFGSSWKNYVIPKSGGNTYLPRIDVDNYPEPRTNTALWVMDDYDFMIYTGGWSLTITPDVTLSTWLGEYAPVNVGYTPGSSNYNSWIDANYDTYVNALMSSANTTVAKTLSYAAEDLMMGAAGMITMWYDSGYTATLSSENNFISAIGVGFDNWFSFLDGTPGTNVHITSPGYSNNALYFGWSSDFQNLNIISSQWVWDYFILNEIYDSLITTNPYDVSNIIPALASSLPTYNANGMGSYTLGTVINATLRSNVYWQNVPQMDRTAFTADGGSELNGPMQNYLLTPLDVAFTMQYLSDIEAYSVAWNAPTIMDIDHVAVNPVYNTTGTFAQQQAKAAQGLGWPYWNATAYPNGPQWENVTWIQSPTGGNDTSYAYRYDFVHFDSSVPVNGIRYYLNDQLTWLTFYRDLAQYIIPMHIFEYLGTGTWQHAGKTIPQVQTMKLESPAIVAGGADLDYGTGPYILASGVASQSYTMIANVPGATWVGGGGHPMTETFGSFWSNAAAPQIGAATSTVGITGYGLIFNTTLTNSGSATNINYEWSYQVYKSNGTMYNIPAGSGTTTTITGYSTPAGTSFIVGSAVLGVSGPLSVKWGDQIEVLLSYTYLTGGRSYTVVYAPTYLGVYPADIAGHAVRAPYYGSDGSVNAKDQGPISSNWLAIVPLGTNPASTLARADINKDGTVNAKDAGPISSNWLGTWSVPVY